MKKCIDNKNKIEIECTINKIRFYKENWGIVVVTVDKLIQGTLQTPSDNTILKGQMPNVKEGESYSVVATYIEDAKWGGQYNIEMMTSNVILTEASGRKRFLESIFTPKQIKNLYKVLPDPFETFENEDYKSLVQVKGCGIKNAVNWMERFKANRDRAKIYAELKDYNLSASIIDKLLSRYHSSEIVIDKVKANPYTLVTEVKGIGWVIADRIALAGGIGKYDEKRVGAFIYYYLDEEAESGYSWITTDQLMGAILEHFGEEIPDSAITDGIHYLSDDDKLWWNEEKDKIGLKWVYNLEMRIAEEIIRIIKGENDFDISGMEDAIARIERLQGWEYTEEQINGIKMALESNFILIQGGSGTGKTSLVKAVLETIKHCKFTQCALSGKAASRLMEVTGEEGYTIHRLLGFPKGEDNKGKFVYHDENQLDYDIIIVDEISMIDLSLFYHLLRAVKTGSKVICLGDNGQLEAIGSGNIAYDILCSPEVPSITLTKIHRQAEKSAIITESVKVRNKVQIVPKDWVGHEVRGELQDLDITCYSDASNTYYKVLEQFARYWDEHKDIKNIQVMVPVRTKGQTSTYMLNNAIQELCNPKTGNTKEIVQYASKGLPYYLREGDKVINTVNNYKVEPNIYNGNIGIIQKFWEDEDEDEEYMTVDFDGIGKVDIPKSAWKGIELAYCITIHKYQGSEADIIIFGLDFNAYTLLSKELVYTGITRAKKKCYLIAQTGALRYATANSSIRLKQTHLQQCLHEIAHPTVIF